MSENNKNISISQFVKEYKQITNEGQKKAYVKKHIIRNYCPILEKINVLQAMNDKSIVDNEYGKYIDMTVSKLNSVMAVLILYTDIRTDKNEQGVPKTWECYDLLQSTGLISKILEFIGDDIDELMRVQKEVLDTWHMKNTTTKAYVYDLLNKISDRVGVAAGAGMKELSEILDDENKIKKFYSISEKFFKKITK